MGQPLIILGMHRSGTSALAGALAHAGVDVGPHLVPADALVNARGFWEHAGVVAIHDRLLAKLDSVWSDVRELPAEWWQRDDVRYFQTELIATLSTDFGNSPLWLLKDPRMCRLLPMWTEIFQKMGLRPLYISMMRDPIEVARSLAARDGIGQERAAVLWLLHVLSAERHIRRYGGLRITYANLLRDWRSSMRQVCAGLPAHSLDWESRAPAIAAFLEPDLRRQINEGNDATELKGFTAVASDLYRRLAEHPHTINEAELARVREMVGEYQNRHGELLTEVAHGDALLKTLRLEQLQLQVEVAALRREIQRIKSSVSWRASSPLRLLWNVWQRLVS